MALTLSKGALASHEAGVEERLRACGALLWPQTVLQRYQDEQERKALAEYSAKSRATILGFASLFNTCVVGAIAILTAFSASPLAGAAIMVFYLWGKFLFHMGEPPAWRTSSLFGKDLYWRDGTKRILPAQARNVADAVRILFPDARFSVSFLGYDPILHVVLNDVSYNVLVWDENEDGSIAIVPPSGA